MTREHDCLPSEAVVAEVAEAVVEDLERPGALARDGLDDDGDGRDSLDDRGGTSRGFFDRRRRINARMSNQRVAGELSDDEFVAAIEAAVDDGERDLCAGGVAPAVLAARVGLDESWVRERCKRLVEAGRLDAVEGVAPGSLQPRTGYLLAAGE